MRALPLRISPLAHLSALAGSLVAATLLAVPGTASAQQSPGPGKPDILRITGPVSQDIDLRNLPEIPPRQGFEPVRLTRWPNGMPPPAAGARPVPKETPRRVPEVRPLPLTPAPAATYPGITSVQSGCGCLPPDTDGDVGPNHYIQSVNSRIKIIDKAGTQLLAPTTFNSFFSALGASNPCGNNQNDGDGVVYYDHAGDRWVVTDFAFPAFPGTSFYECIGVSKTPDPVAGGWWLYAVQVDPANTAYLGDYPKFGTWNNAWYLTMNLFSNNTTFNGVRVYALDRASMMAGTGSNAIGFTIDPTTLGNSYSLVPATYRFGGPPAGADEYLLAIDSTDNSVSNNAVYAWRFHADFATPANSTFGVGVAHAPNATITVNAFYDALEGTGASAVTNEVPQQATTARLDTLGDKLMYPLYYQNLGGVESLWAVHTVNTGSNATGFTNPTGIRWYQFNVTGGVLPATPAQQQTFTNGADGLWRWMPSLALDAHGNLAINYTVSSGSMFPDIRYAARKAGDAASTLAQGEATLVTGGGRQSSSSGRWGDYSGNGVDIADGCSFWMTNEYYSANGTSAWNTRIGNFRFAPPDCTAPVDLGITNTDGVSSYTPGGTVTYTITASNPGLSSAPGTTVADTFPAGLTCTWTCSGANGGTCAATGSGNINDATVSLPRGGSSVTYVATCSVSLATSGTLSNTATVTTGSLATDGNLANNTATDSDTQSTPVGLTDFQAD